MNIIGEYEGIIYRFTYKEFCIPDVDGVVQTLKFAWPGRIPEDKDFAEEGIKALFLKSLKDGGISYKVVDDKQEQKAIDLEEEAVYSDYDNI